MTQSQPRVSGASLRMWRLNRHMKQSYCAELLEISQSYLSKLESSTDHLPEEIAAKFMRLAEVTHLSDQDRGIKQLVEFSPLPVHLVCDHSHRLLAASRSRLAQWRKDLSEVEGQALKRYATEEITQAETTIYEQGWFDEELHYFEGETRSASSDDMRIPPAKYSWQRLRLADGSPVRLCTSQPKDQQLTYS